MCSVNSSSLEVSYLHLGESCPILAIWLADLPRLNSADVFHFLCKRYDFMMVRAMLQIFDEVLQQVVASQMSGYTERVRRFICHEMHEGDYALHAIMHISTRK